MKLVIGFFAFIFAIVAGYAHAEDFNKQDIEKIVHDYIVANGGVIANSVDGYLEEKRREAAMNLVSDHSPVSGNPDAKVVFIEFADFRCGYCRRVQETVDTLREKYQDRVQFVFKNMPILTEESRQAATAAMAAHKQGKFWEYSEQLWENQPRLGEELFVEVAKNLKLDMVQFNKDRASKEILDQVQNDFMDGQKAGVQGTPHFVIDGNALSGAQPIAQFVEVLDTALSTYQE